MYNLIFLLCSIATSISIVALLTLSIHPSIHLVCTFTCTNNVDIHMYKQVQHYKWLEGLSRNVHRYFHLYDSSISPPLYDELVFILPCVWLFETAINTFAFRCSQNTSLFQALPLPFASSQGAGVYPLAERRGTPWTGHWSITELFTYSQYFFHP